MDVIVLNSSWLVHTHWFFLFSSSPLLLLYFRTVFLFVDCHFVVCQDHSTNVGQNSLSLDLMVWQLKWFMFRTNCDMHNAHSVILHPHSSPNAWVFAEFILSRIFSSFHVLSSLRLWDDFLMILFWFLYHFNLFSCCFSMTQNVRIVFVPVLVEFASVLCELESVSDESLKLMINWYCLDIGMFCNAQNSFTFMQTHPTFMNTRRSVRSSRTNYWGTFYELLGKRQ